MSAVGAVHTVSADAALLPPGPRAWLDSGELVRIDGRELYVHERRGAGPPLLLLHGYPSSSYDWRALLDLLGERHVVCFDFLGFGLSEKPPGEDYSLMTQADLAQAVWRERIGEPVALVAHDMGTSVANELMARDIEGKLGIDLAGVLLFNGSMILEAASLTISQKILRSRAGPLLARFSSERIFKAQFGRIFSERHPLSDAEAADQWALLAHRGGNRIIHRLTNYLHERVTYAERWHGAIRDWEGELRLAWGMRDPVATPRVLDAVLALRPAAPVTRFDELGHYPQIEDPEPLAKLIAGSA